MKVMGLVSKQQSGSLSNSNPDPSCGFKHRTTTIPTLIEIENARTDRGGFTRAQLASWGISWPPPKGWLEALKSLSVAAYPDKPSMVWPRVVTRGPLTRYGLDVVILQNERDAIDQGLAWVIGRE